MCFGVSCAQGLEPTETFVRKLEVPPPLPGKSLYHLLRCELPQIARPHRVPHPSSPFSPSRAPPSTRARDVAEEPENLFQDSRCARRRVLASDKERGAWRVQGDTRVRSDDEARRNHSRPRGLGRREPSAALLLLDVSLWIRLRRSTLLTAGRRALHPISRRSQRAQREL